MNVAALRLTSQLIFRQVVLLAITGIIACAFAPNLLLIDSGQVNANMPLGVSVLVAIAICNTVIILVLTRRLRPLLHALSLGSDVVAPRDLVALYILPARITVIGVIAGFVITSSTLLPQIRPPTNDLPAQISLYALLVTIGSLAALPAYVSLRAAVSHVLELAPIGAARQARAMLEFSHWRLSSVRSRILIAVALSVAFVALGASLLVLAHVRVFNREARETSATELARSTMEVIDGSVAGRNEAIAEARHFGFQLNASPMPAMFRAERTERDTRLTVPLDEGHATIVFGRRPTDPVSGIYLLLTLAATALAAGLGSRVGAAFAADVTLATRSVQGIGVEDVLRGARLRRDARFSCVANLTTSVDQLGDVFREFAAAQERAIEARASTERMRGLFLASMSHDLKAPLNAILGFAALASRHPMTHPQRQSIAIIEQRGRELLHLLQTILDAGRVEAGALVLGREMTKPGELVTQALQEARNLVQESGVSLVGEISQDAPSVLVDPTRIVQALAAVILTAARFVQHGTLLVRATVPSPTDRLRLDVEVPPPGIADSELEKIFEAFKYPERARQHGSLGLGLSLARSILELHRGTIEATNAPSTGTQFTIWIPVKDQTIDTFPPSSP